MRTESNVLTLKFQCNVNKFLRHHQMWTYLSVFPLCSFHCITYCLFTPLYFPTLSHCVKSQQFNQQTIHAVNRASRYVFCNCTNSSGAANCFTVPDARICSQGIVFACFHNCPQSLRIDRKVNSYLALILRSIFY